MRSGSDRKKEAGNVKNLAQIFTTIIGCLFFTMVWLNERAFSKQLVQPSDYAMNDVFKGHGGRPVTLDDVLITVKTTRRYHHDRVDVITKTWFKYARKQTYFITDFEDLEYQQKTGNHMVATNCNETHGRNNLCCKMDAEYDTFMATDKKWWCHVDDDNYVNVDRLVELLNKFDWRDKIYLGKRSVHKDWGRRFNRRKILFKFGTGGAGICITRPTAIQMVPYFGNGGFLKMCQKLSTPDDSGFGFVVNGILGINITESKVLHSHLENLASIAESQLTKQATLSFKKRNVVNIIKANRLFSHVQDPSRFKSLHCLIYPMDSLCDRT